MKKWYYSLLALLLLFSGTALADSSNPEIYSTAVANKTDLSIAYLSSVFGTVSGVLNGTSGQMLGKLLYQFNQGMLVVAGCWLGFSVLVMVFKATGHGSFMHQDNKVPMILLRVALGFSLLIPNPSTGYTLLQGIVMQVTVQGVKLANQVWDYGLDYMKAGGALWSRPVQQTNSALPKPTAIISNDDMKSVLGNQDNSDVKNFSNLGMVQKIMSMEACMVQSSIDYDNKNSGDDVSNAGTFSVYEDTDTFSFSFPGGSGDGNSSCGIIYWNNLVSSKEPLNCQTPANGASPSDDNSACGFSRLALREAIFQLLPAVKKYVCIQNNSDASSICNSIDPASGGDPSYMTDAMMGALLNYKNLIDPIVRKESLLNTKVDPLIFTTQAKKDGWMTAGRYYWDLLRVEGFYDQTMTRQAHYKNYIPSQSTQPATGSLDKNTPNTLLTATVGDNGYIAKVIGQVENFSGAAKSGNAATSMSASFGTALKWLSLLFAPIIGELVGLLMAFSTNVGPLGLGPEPILWLHNIGMLCLSLGGNIWLSIAVALFPLYAGLFICQSVNSLGKAAEGVVNWLQPILLMVGGAFFVVGISLGYYMPLYPYMLFTFGVIGWIIAVIEAMVAAPIVAFGITHTEGGHDFLGRSVNALLMLVGLFLRPVLMLIGLFAAMILCQVSLSIILYTFAGFASDIFYVTQPLGGSPGGDILLSGVGVAMSNAAASGDGTFLMKLLMPLLVFPIFLMIFTMLVYTATTTCFSLTYQLPDYILTWIGGHQHHGAGAQSMADQVKQGITAAAHKVGDAMNRKPAKKKDAEIQAGGGQQPAPQNPDQFG